MKAVRFHQHGAPVRRRIREDDEPDAVALTPHDLRSVWHVRGQRLQQHTVERLLGDSVLLGAPLRVPADGDVSQPGDVAIEMIHPPSFWNNGASSTSLDTRCS